MTPSRPVLRSNARPPRKTLAEQATEYEAEQRRLKQEATERRRTAAAGKKVANAR